MIRAKQALGQVRSNQVNNNDRVAGVKVTYYYYCKYPYGYLNGYNVCKFCINNRQRKSKHFNRYL